MKLWLAMLGIALVGGSAILSGAIQGHLSRRWGPSQQLQDAAARIGNLPKDFGAWHMNNERQMNQDTIDVLECAGYAYREYVHGKTGETVTMVLTVGPSGPTSVHTPEICYSSQDYTIHEETKRILMSDAGIEPADELWATTFKSAKGEFSLLRVFYGWNAGDRWQAADSARIEFVGRPYLYKIQVVGNLALGDETPSDPCRNFLKDFLPIVRRHLTETTTE